MRRRRLHAALGLAGRQLRYYPGRTALAVLGVVLAVVLITSLVGLGEGVTSAGTSALRWLDQDLWVTAGPLQFAPGTIGGVRNQLTDAHTVTAEVERTPGVDSAGALAFQTVYVSPNRSEFRTLVGVGGVGNTSKFSVQEGPGFQRGDVHYANGTYQGPMTNAVVIDERTAALFNVTVGDQLYIGGTIASAREHRFTVVGVSRTFSTFLGTATVTLHLSELQEISGTTGTDPASMIVVRLTPGADEERVQRRLSQRYPDYTVRTNREQLRAFIGNQAAVIAGAVTLVVLATVTGAILVVNLLALVVYHQRRELAVLKASGVSSGTLVVMVGAMGVLIGTVGATVGVVVTPALAAGLNAIVSELTGFTNLVRTAPWISAVGGAIGVVMGGIGAAVAGWRVTRLSPLAHLRS